MVMVGMGAMVGACLRVFLSQFNGRFPWMTLFINVSGSFLLGLFSHLEDSFLFFGTGMMGGFTTFSTFALESVTLFSQDKRAALVYIGLSALLPPLSFLAGVLIL
ncbi:CrcB family protein [Macrococcus hajekii]|uniref:Fluoride-specific ion channel FluC n=1 Tax=Macrococcus hajekii TaxID=198482 RepID=A0A4R6BLE5_9STAP|nr:CrcB family protein [Macrococcus hajekii]TDM02610.1 CrcB family protein [Macrococcus hajekii]GGB02437.1 putative fluoride ion transporter CrcB [Macrococcus hajekii]